MELNLSGKTVLVTGSSRGIGRTIAETFIHAGCKVALNGRTAAALKRTLSEIGNNDTIAVTGDVSKPPQAKAVLDQLLDRYGKLDILVCNAGSGQSVPPGEESLEEWHRVFEMNLWSATTIIETCRKALYQSSGAIVCISSICGQEVVPGAPITYSTAKAALNAYVRGSARPLGKLGIRINAISPGNILFDGSVWSRKITEDSEAVAQMLENNVSLARLGKPQDVANLAVWLASPLASFCTGSIFVADGGQVHN